MKNSLDRIEHYKVESSLIKRSILRRDGTVVTTDIIRLNGKQEFSSAVDEFDYAWLRLKEKPEPNHINGHVRVVDLFSGAGGLSIGIEEACRALGVSFEVVYANDIDKDILKIYEANFLGAHCVSSPIEEILDGEVGEPLSQSERELKSKLGRIDILVGGPPCQGNSDLNNHTRRQDPKNELYLKMARFCEIVKPRHVIIENVPGVLHDKKRVALRTWEKLREMGYKLDSNVINAYRIGVAQNRKRSITLASLDVDIDFDEYINQSTTSPRNLSWAIGDLVANKSRTIFDKPSILSPENIIRVDYLFDNNLFDLPDSERPDCHKLKKHTYKSVYGRLKWDLPSPTLTTGFRVPGRGRYIHPSQRRTLTLHEGARIQYFPDFFKFPLSRGTLLQKVIGNAVPSRLGYSLAIHLLR